jgi:hypothetical protein
VPTFIIVPPMPPQALTPARLWKAGTFFRPRDVEPHIGKTSIVDESVAALKCCFSNFMQRLRVTSAKDYVRTRFPGLRPSNAIPV